jgi:transcriptional regulator with GAF, ATPase, and Fis domain
VFADFSIKRVVLSVCGILILAYAFIVLLFVQVAPDLGLRTVFNNELRARPVDFYPETGDYESGDRIVAIGGQSTGDGTPRKNWGDILNAPSNLEKSLRPERERLQRGGAVSLGPDFQLRKLAGEDWVVAASPENDEEPSFFVRLKLERQEGGQTYYAWCRLGQVPIQELIPSLLWFFLKATLLFLGAWHWWRRPKDPAAEQFYLMSLVTVGAFIGGYHWSLLVSQPPLLIVFIICGTLLPAFNLHFYLIFPQPKAWMTRRPKAVLAFIYGVPLAFTSTILYLYLDHGADLDHLRFVVDVYFGVAASWYVACVAALLHSFATVTDPTERNQVKSILLGASLALVPICYSLWMALFDRNAFSDGRVTWPMFAASAILTVAYAVSITRYRLMDLDKLLSSSMDYFVVSFLAAALYYAVVFVGTLLFKRYIGSPTFAEAATFSAVALLLLLVLDQARGRVRKFLDRRFAKQKTQLDRTLQRMGQAIEQLVDPHALAMKFLNATTDLLGASQGAVFLRQGDPSIYRLAGFQGSAPTVGELTPGSPLVDALRLGKAVEGRPKHYEPLSLAQRQLKTLGGELAHPIMHEERLLAFVVLGPKEPPYRPEDAELLAAFAQITGLALQSAEGHRTIEQLNQELRGKVQKISEQQRRILALQSQLHRQIAPPRLAPALPPPNSSSDAEAAADAAPAKSAATPIPTAAGIVGESSELQHLLAMVRKVAVTDAVVLLRGESGTGKELIARAVHESSPRAEKAFVKVHCAALSPSLLESELFGHVKGAFTGAHKDKMGRFEMAHGGTLFLDEIGDITLDVQTKLLRVLQERVFERVGSSEPIQVDVRIITATHQNLETLIRQNRFREDLFYRLNVFPVQVPPLRQRLDDIPALALHFMRQAALKCKKELGGIDDEAMELLKSYSWPGNVRQLENVLERAVVIADGATVGVGELPAEVFQYADEEPINGFADLGDHESTVTRPLTSLRRERLRMEREELVRAMAAARGNKSEAARALGIARSTLVSRLKKFGLV